MMKPNRLHLSFLLLIPVFFIAMGASRDMDTRTSLAATIAAVLFATFWISYLIKDRKDEVGVERY